MPYLRAGPLSRGGSSRAYSGILSLSSLRFADILGNPWRDCLLDDLASRLGQVAAQVLEYPAQKADPLVAHHDLQPLGFLLAGPDLIGTKNACFEFPTTHVTNGVWILD